MCFSSPIHARRDVSLFLSDASGFNQRATIKTRRENGAILFRMEFIKAIIHRDKAILFPAR